MKYYASILRIGKTCTSVCYPPCLILFFLIVFVQFSISGYTQNIPFPKQWDKTLGGTSNESLTTLVAGKDGGYLLAGYTSSGKEFEKSEDSIGCWIVKVDADGNKQWDKRVTRQTKVVGAAAASDSSYLILVVDNFSSVDTGFNYVLIKVDSHGKKQWDKTFRGSHGYEGLKELTQLVASPDGGCLLGGTAYSKEHLTNGYLIVKIDSIGNKQWERTISGRGVFRRSYRCGEPVGPVVSSLGAVEGLAALVASPDGGYILGGSSSSLKGFDKSEDNRGFNPAAKDLRDSIIVILDCFPTPGTDGHFFIPIKDTVYYCGAHSLCPNCGWSGIGPSDTRAQNCASSGPTTDYWIVKVDASGNIVWDKVIGGAKNDNLNALVATADGGYLLGGASNSNIGFDKSKDLEKPYWIIKVNASGSKEWDKTFVGGSTIMAATNDSGFFVGNTKCDKKGAEMWRIPYSVTSLAVTADGGFILGATSSSVRAYEKSENGHGGSDMWIVKYGNSLSKCGPEGCMDALSTANISLINPGTSDVLRPVKDLEIWGGIGEDPLVWMRYGNSQSGNYVHNFGYYNWAHSYQYDISDAGTDSLGRHYLLVHYPEGEQNFFVQESGEWKPVHAGINKRLSQAGDEFTLQMANGFRYRFLKLTKAKVDRDSIYYQLRDIKDSYQNIYHFDYNYDKLSRISEPAGRFLALEYSTKFVTTISKVKTWDNRTVEYHYASNLSYPRLDSVSYGDETRAKYTYLSSGLLEHAIDPRYEGSATNIKYAYRDTFTQFIESVKSGVTDQILVTLQTAGDTKTLIYRNGGKKEYKMPPELQGHVKSYTDGLGSKTNYEYGVNDIGFFTKASKPLGRTITYNDITKYGNPKKITYADNSIEEWTRDELDLVLTYKNQLGQITTYGRDEKHRVIRIDYYDGSYETFSNYNTFGQPANHRRRNGGTEHFVYDGRGLLESFTNAEESVTSYAYDGAGRLKTVTDAHGNKTTFEYNERGLLTKMINPGGSFQEYKYDKFGNRTKVINELGKTWTREYDEFGRPKKIIDPILRETKFEYNLASSGCCSYIEKKPSAITLPTGKKTTIAYDVEWSKTSETTGAGSSDEATTFYQYDAVSRPVKMIDAKGKQWQTEYDVMDRKKSETDPLLQKTQWTYDAISRVLTDKRPDNSITTNTYDDVNRKTQTTDPKGQVTKADYNAEGNMVKLTDARNKVTDIEYDLLNRKKKMIYPDGSFENYTYDAVSNVKTVTNRAGNTRTSIYDSRNRLLNSAWNSNLAPSVTYTYDDANRLSTESSSVSALGYTYNDAHEITSETQAIAGTTARTFNYTYTEDGLKKSLAYPSGKELIYTYTEKNQLASVKEDGLTLALYTYDFNGNRTDKVLKNGTTTKSAYDNSNRLLSIDNQNNNCTSFGRFDYKYDNLNRISFVQRDNDKGDVFSYDSTDQVTNVKYEVTNPDGASSVPARTVSYVWDSTGNRKRMTENGTVTNYVTNSLNQYTSLDGKTPTYTSLGSLETWDGWTYVYDAENRLTKARNRSDIVDFEYDPRNRCVKRTINGVTSFLYHDNWNLAEERNTSQALVARYVHGASVDEILTKTSAEDTFYYHHDVIGNVVGLTNALGNVLEQYTYDVFGEPTIKDGVGNNIATSAFHNRFMFTGREYLKEIGLYDYRHRIYSSKLGRFHQTDPIGFAAGDVNLYSYVNNDAVNGSDPSGLIQNQKKKIYPLPTVEPIPWWVRAADWLPSLETLETANNFTAGMADNVPLLGAGVRYARESNPKYYAQVDESSLAYKQGSAGQTGVNAGLLLAGGAAIVTARVAAAEVGMVNVASAGRTAHILAGEGLFSSSGGHAWFASVRSFWNGLTRAKDMFPATWSSTKIMHAISEVATAPTSIWIQRSGVLGAWFTRKGNPAEFFVDGVYEGVKIRVLVIGNIITAYTQK